MWVKKIQIRVLGIKLDFQANKIPPLFSRQNRRPLSAGAKEERERDGDGEALH